jgi:protein-L-isoaspartate(D-aspartate) O-methyltransferase
VAGPIPRPVVVPLGTGLDSDRVRGHLVDALRRSAGIADERVLAAIGRVPRHRFVDPALVAQAYEDTSLPIGWGQTISKPSVVARMLELLLQGRAARQAGSLGRTLEIGTGCGYQAAVLAELASDVFSIERVAGLHELARDRLAVERPRGLRLVLGDGMRGHPPNAPYRSIIAAAAGHELPGAWLEQLGDGGRLVAPVVREAGRQVLVVVDREGDTLRRSEDGGVIFVPLKSGISLEGAP